MEFIAFTSRFLIISIILCLLFGCKQQINFTNEELSYISSKEIVYSVGGNYPPFMYVDSYNKLVGISIDYLNLISSRSGLHLTPSKSVCHIAECVIELKTGKVQLIPGIRPTPARSAYISFTRPYFYVDMVIIKQVNTPTTVGVVAGSAALIYITQNQPYLVVTEFEDIDALISALLNAKVDSIIVNNISANSMRKKYNLKFDEAVIPFDYPLSFGISKEDKILKSILDKTIASLTVSDIEDINLKWK